VTVHVDPITEDLIVDVSDGAPPATPSRHGTTVPPPRRRPDRSPRRPRELTLIDLWTMVGSIVSAICLNWMVFFRLTAGSSVFGFLLCTYVTFLLLYWVVTVDRLGRLVATDRVMTVFVISAGIIVLIPLVLLISYIFVEGLKALRLTFLTEDQTGIVPLDPATAGGGSHAIIGTIEQVGLALLWSVPLGLAAAVFLNESRSPWRRPVRIFVDAMSGLPSIVAGLFIYATLILPLAKKSDIFGFNGFMASLALALIMLPTITRTVEVVLRLVPDGLREASLALGSSRVRTVWSVVFPTARTGITTAEAGVEHRSWCGRLLQGRGDRDRWSRRRRRLRLRRAHIEDPASVLASS
jgi:phosphate transport system permease protein